MAAKILVVENDDQVARVFHDQLDDDGYEVDVVPSGSYAALKILETSYDLIIMDLALSGMDGAITALALRGLGYQGPIIVATGGLLPIDETLYDRIGFAGRLLKPLHLTELSAEVKRHLAKGGP